MDVRSRIAGLKIDPTRMMGPPPKNFQKRPKPKVTKPKVTKLEDVDVVDALMRRATIKTGRRPPSNRRRRTHLISTTRIIQESDLEQKQQESPVRVSEPVTVDSPITNIEGNKKPNSDDSFNTPVDDLLKQSQEIIQPAEGDRNSKGELILEKPTKQSVSHEQIHQDETKTDDQENTTILNSNKREEEGKQSPVFQDLSDISERRSSVKEQVGIDDKFTPNLQEQLHETQEADLPVDIPLNEVEKKSSICQDEGSEMRILHSSSETEKEEKDHIHSMDQPILSGSQMVSSDNIKSSITSENIIQPEDSKKEDDLKDDFESQNSDSDSDSLLHSNSRKDSDSVNDDEKTFSVRLSSDFEYKEESNDFMKSTLREHLRWDLSDGRKMEGLLEAKEVFLEDGETLSCGAACQKMIALGTSLGNIILLDVYGSVISVLDTHKGHRITDIDISRDSTYLASCASNGRVTVLDSRNMSYVMDHRDDQNISFISMSQTFEESQSVAIGSDERPIALLESWTVPLFQWKIISKPRDIGSWTGEKTFAIAWGGLYLAWACPIGIFVYDKGSDEVVMGLQPPCSEENVSSSLPCILFWYSPNQLIVGWDHEVHIISFIQDPNDTSSRSVRISNKFKTEKKILGLVPRKDENLVLLCYGDDAIDLVITTRSGDVIKSIEIDQDIDDAMSYKLSGFGQDWSFGALYLVVSNTNCWILEIRDTEDSIVRLVRRGKFQEALEKAETELPDGPSKSGALWYIVEKYHRVLKEKSNGNALEISKKYALDDSPEAWIRWIDLFFKFDWLPAVIDDIPLENPKLPRGVYLKVSESLKHSNKDAYLHLRDIWPEEYLVD